MLNWREFQHYTDRDPPWIKLHQRKLLDKPEWRRLSGAAGKLLVDLWMLAAGTKEGDVMLRLADLGYRFRSPLPRLARGLMELERAEFVALSNQMQSDASAAQSNADTERETEAEGETQKTTTNTALRAVRT